MSETVSSVSFRFVAGMFKHFIVSCVEPPQVSEHQ